MSAMGLTRSVHQQSCNHPAVFTQQDIESSAGCVVGHHFHTDTPCLQAGNDRRCGKLQPFAGTDNDNLGVEAGNDFAMFRRQFIDMRRFPELNDIRCNDDAAVNNLLIHRDFSIAIGTDTVAGK